MGQITLLHQTYVRDDQKDIVLQKTRNVSFRDIIHALTNKNTVLDIQHHNQDKYPGQKKLIIVLDGYPHEVPYIQQGSTVFLKTIIPNRKLKKLFTP